MAGKLQKIIILDFGSQYTQLICKKIRENGFFAEIYPYTTKLSILQQENVMGLILSGSPLSVTEKSSVFPDLKIFSESYQKPILGICYGLQIITHAFKGAIHCSTSREFGNATLSIHTDSVLLKGFEKNSSVWMSHGDKIHKIPSNFISIATTGNSPNAIIQHKSRKIFGIQFHPEVHQSQKGQQLLYNFCSQICNMQKNWEYNNFIQDTIEDIRTTVGKKRVLLGLSGGVDSFVAARLIDSAIGKQLSCVYVNTGLMRKGETQEVNDFFSKNFSSTLHTVDASQIFITSLKGITEPEKKRIIIGNLFLDTFQRKSKEIGHHEFLAQGTLYTDIIESGTHDGISETIKSHHNRVPKVQELINAGTVIEPLKDLFKDEVRKVGKRLNLTKEILTRHPFPGPGLAIRILGEVTPYNLRLLQEADDVLIKSLKRENLYESIWQAFVVFLPIKSVGVMGDKRTYENVACIRMISSIDGMTASVSRVPFNFLEQVSNDIINHVKGINRVVYDISSKPPSTIEWE